MSIAAQNGDLTNLERFFGEPERIDPLPLLRCIESENLDDFNAVCFFVNEHSESGFNNFESSVFRRLFSPVTSTEFVEQVLSSESMFSQMENNDDYDFIVCVFLRQSRV